MRAVPHVAVAVVLVQGEQTVALGDNVNVPCKHCKQAADAMPDILCNPQGVGAAALAGHANPAGHGVAFQEAAPVGQ